MTILALDIASKVGWAVQRGDCTEPEPLFIYGATAEFKHEDWGARCHFFQNWLLDKIDELNPDIVAIERPYPFGGNQVYILNNMVGHDHSAAFACAVERREYDVWDIRKWLGFPRKMGRTWYKRETTKAMAARGFSPTDDNQADSIALLLYAIEQEKERAA